MQFITLLLSVTFCLSKTLLLVPKPYTLSVFDNFHLNEFNKEHDVHEFVNINDVVIYKTENTNYLNTLEQLFYVEEEGIYKISFLDNLYYDFLENVDVIFDETRVPWHLGRVINRDLPLNNTFNYLHCNTNDDIIVNNIVIDTGIDIHHPEFEGSGHQAARQRRQQDRSPRDSGAQERLRQRHHPRRKRRVVESRPAHLHRG